MESENPLTSRDALLVVDVQNDFLPGGALAVPEGDAVIPVINRWIAWAKEAGAPVFASRDWHPPDHGSFREQGGPWPPHCTRESQGAAFGPGLRLPEDARIVSKGTDRGTEGYSAFEGTDLSEALRRLGVERLFVCGLAQDYCVKASAIAGLRAGFEVHLVTDATRPVDVQPGDGERALEALREEGVALERTPGAA